jgi:ubiquinone/menaquinone biosynthesis C-methylase UbiE
MSAIQSNSSEQTQIDGWSSSAYNKTAAFVYSSSYTNKILSWLAPQLGERIIDFGCGTGELTVELAKLVGEEGYVLGFDASNNMVRPSTFIAQGGSVMNLLFR